METGKPIFQFQVVLKQSVTHPEQWEFVHPGKDSTGTPYPNYTWMLPLNHFPITHKVNPNGILVDCINQYCNNPVKGAFHRYDKSRFFSAPHFYIGSPYQQLRGDTAQQWRTFVSKFGLISGKPSVHKLEIFPNHLFVFI
jgi:hypothetical protein